MGTWTLTIRAARTPRLVCIAAAGMLAVAAPKMACAQAATAPTVARPDPWESANRRFYAVHQTLDRAIIRPAAMGYKAIAPEPLRIGIHNGLSNLSEPRVLVNDVLQLRIKDAVRTVGRFVLNSTFGIAGLFDIATRAGLPHHDNGFGVTLGRYGVGPGPYVFLPLVGPSTVRDLIGGGADVAGDPLLYTRFRGRWTVDETTAVVGGLDQRLNADDDLKTIKATSTDSYATLRSLYLQNREALIRGKPVDVQSLPDFVDPAAPGGAAPASAGSASPTPQAADAAKPNLPDAPKAEAGALPTPGPQP